MNREYLHTIERLHEQHGDKLKPPQGVDHLIPYFGMRRVEVTGPWGVRRGRIGITTGWGPVLILLPNANARCSGDVLDPEDKVTAIITPASKRIPV